MFVSYMTLIFLLGSFNLIIFWKVVVLNRYRFLWARCYRRFVLKRQFIFWNFIKRSISVEQRNNVFNESFIFRLPLFMFGNRLSRSVVKINFYWSNFDHSFSYLLDLKEKELRKMLGAIRNSRKSLLKLLLHYQKLY